MTSEDLPSRWVRFWHEPLRAESLALTRIFFAVALLAEQLTQYLPNLDSLFGPQGFGRVGVADGVLSYNWRWSVLFFYTDDPTTIAVAFWLWTAATVALLVGWQTRCAAVLTWFGAYCFVNRHWFMLNGGDDVLLIGLILLMISPCGAALSMDRRLSTRRLGEKPAAVFIPPWSIRLFQIQLCVIYTATGLTKVDGPSWWDGTSIHYLLQDPTMVRFSAAQFAIPIWITAPMTWVSLAWEVLFVPLVLWPRTRKWTLWFGVLFHIGIYALVEVGWFSFYTLAMYGVWIRLKSWREPPVRRDGEPGASTTGVSR